MQNIELCHGSPRPSPVGDKLQALWLPEVVGGLSCQLSHTALTLWFKCDSIMSQCRSGLKVTSLSEKPFTAVKEQLLYLPSSPSPSSSAEDYPVTMKTTHILLLCILGAALVSTVVCDNSINPNDCCFKFYPRRMKKDLVKDYYVTDHRCPRTGVM
ncbi:hypothetical protein Q8A73_013342 [Channa argus]|nr:hypothetical protein Q8A73_013342 [Channa argus]